MDADPEVDSLDSEVQRNDYLKRVNDAARDSFARRQVIITVVSSWLKK